MVSVEFIANFNLQGPNSAFSSAAAMIPWAHHLLFLESLINLAVAQWTRLPLNIRDCKWKTRHVYEFIEIRSDHHRPQMSLAD